MSDVSEPRAMVLVAQRVKSSKAIWHVVDTRYSTPRFSRCGIPIEAETATESNILSADFSGCRRCLDRWWTEVLGIHRQPALRGKLE
jgi:hypothetical protein